MNTETLIYKGGLICCVIAAVLWAIGSYFIYLGQKELGMGTATIADTVIFEVGFLFAIGLIAVTIYLWHRYFPETMRIRQG